MSQSEPTVGGEVSGPDPFELVLLALQARLPSADSSEEVRPARKGTRMEVVGDEESTGKKDAPQKFYVLEPLEITFLALQAQLHSANPRRRDTTPAGLADSRLPLDKVP